MTKRLFISRNPYRFSDAFRLFRTLRKAQPFHPSPAGGRGQGEGGSSLRLRKTARAVAISPAFSVFFLLISSCGYFDHTESVSPASSPDGGSGDQGGASGNESTNSVSEGDGAVVQISGGNSGASGNAGEISNVSGGGSATTGSTGAGGSSSSSGGAPTGNIGGADASGNDRGGAGGSEGQDAGESDSASEKCTDNDDCSPNVCDLISGVCTECLADGTGCQGNKKLCKPGSTAAENMCVECLTHDNCPGNACDFTRYVCVPCVIENGSPIGCSDDSGKPQCKVDENAPDKNACVECTERAHCSGNTPICDANACRGCKKHDECDYAGGVCKWDTGGCLSDTAVIYVDKGNTTATCNEYRLSSGTKNVPYCVLQSAINAVTSTSRNTVLAYSATYDRITVSNKSVPVLIVGRGAVIAPSSNNETNVYIDGASNVTLEGLTIRDAGGSSNGYGIRCVGTENSPTLTVRRSTITNNANGGVVADNCANVTLDSNTITANAGGGVSLNTSGFEVRNNIIAGNGGDNAAYGGIYIATPGDTAKITYNTVTKNNSSGAKSGILCTIGNCSNVIVNSNISADNYDGDISDTLRPSYCLIRDGVYTGDSTNLKGDPVIDSTYHLRIESPRSSCIDAADPTSSYPAYDIDGEKRPQGSLPDIGADEAG